MEISSAMTLACMVVGPLATNCYVLSCTETGESVVLDPGGDAHLIKSFIQTAGLKPVKIVCTHGHSDHIASVAELQREYGIDVAVHESAVEIVKSSVKEAPFWGLGTIEEPRIDITLSAGDTIRFGTVRGNIRHTPGHSPGGISIVFDGLVIVGDTLFAGSIGRTDLFGGSFDTLMKSIQTELLSLPDETTVHCGHGPETTIGEERRENPFINGYL